jgi:hypothetical protein
MNTTEIPRGTKKHKKRREKEEFSIFILNLDLKLK